MPQANKPSLSYIHLLPQIYVLYCTVYFLLLFFTLCCKLPYFLCLVSSYLKSTLAGSSSHSGCLLSFAKDTFLLRLLISSSLFLECLYKPLGALLQLGCRLNELWDVESTTNSWCLESQKLTQSKDIVGDPVDENGLLKQRILSQIGKCDHFTHCSTYTRHPGCEWDHQYSHTTEELLHSGGLWVSCTSLTTSFQDSKHTS